MKRLALSGGKLSIWVLGFVLILTSAAAGADPTGPRVTDGLLALYLFEQGADPGVVYDVSGEGTALDLTIANPANVTWLTDYGLEVTASTIIESAAAATKIIDACKASNALTIEAWIDPADTFVDPDLDPARIATLSTSSSAHNFTLGQRTNQYIARLRTSPTSPPEMQTPMTAGLKHVVFTRDNAGNRKIYINNESVDSDNFTGNFSTWDSNAGFALANEFDLGRGWLGEYYLVAVYERALSPAEVTQNYDAGPPGGEAPPMEVDIMPLGNSVTKGGQPPDNTYGYRNHLSNGLIDAGYSFRFVGSQGTGALQHEGHSGYHADGGPYGGIATNVFDWLVDNPADVVLLHIGTNDLTAGQLPAGLDGVADDVDAILNEIDAYENDPIGNDVWVILAQIINRADEYSDRTTELNGLIKDLADARRAVGDRIVVVDMENALNYPDDLYHSINEEDVVHPNDAGYYKMAQVWFAALDDALDYMFEVGVFDVALTQDAARGELTCSYALGTEAETAATAWYKGTSPIMAVYLPMEGGADNSLLDYSGNGLAVTKTGDPLWSPAADPDGHGAYAFDGNDGLTAGENFPTSASYTKTAWVYRTGSGSDGVNSIISGDASSGGHRFSAPDGSGNILSAGHNGAWTAVEDSEALASDTWYFVAVTYDAASDTMTLYKNGLAVDSATVSDDVTDATISIGSTGAASGGWQGFIDDVRIYPQALSPQQIESLYLNGKDIVVSQETATGEEWECEVTPFSNIAGGASGDTRGSNPLIYEARADADGDGDVDGDDLQLLTRSFNTTLADPDFDARCDFNLDDRVDAEDLDIFAGEFGDAPAAAPLAVSLSTTSTLSTNTLETETRANEPVRGKSDLASGAKKRGKKRLASSCLGCVTEC